MEATEKLFLTLPKTRKHSLCIISLISVLVVAWLFCYVLLRLVHTDFGYMVKVNKGLHSYTGLALKVKVDRI